MMVERPVLFAAMKRWLWLPWTVILVLVTSLVGQSILWFFDTSPPFVLQQYTVHPVKAGSVLKVDGRVIRDIERSCSVTASRHIIDSRGVKYDVMNTQTMTARSLANMDMQAPGELHLAIEIPKFINPGRAQLVTPLEYICNPLHSAIGGIPVDMVVNFEVIP